MHCWLLLALSLTSWTYAWSLKGQTPLLAGTDPARKIAIIGGGPSGTSSAYFLSFLAKEYPAIAADIHLFEKSDYFGGRSTILPLPGKSQDSHEAYAELGASIFVDANLNLNKAARQFNLSLQDGHGGGDKLENRPMAIWNGEAFVFQASSQQWIDILKMLWRYGRSPFVARRLVRAAVQSFLRLYTSDSASKGPFTVQGLLQELEFTETIQESSLSYYTRNGVSARFVNDIISAATSVNYAQSAFKMQALGGLVSMAATGASSIVGGNRRIFENFALRSGATLRTESSVRSIRKQTIAGKTRWELEWTDQDQGNQSGAYDAVILAAPFHSSGIDIGNSKAANLIPAVDYVDLHVNMVLTNATAPQLCFFDVAQPCSEPGPVAVYTALDAYDQGKTSTRPLVNSLNYLKAFDDGTYAVKLFSRQTLTKTQLETAFGEVRWLWVPLGSAQDAQHNVLWVYEKVWQSYPFLPPLAPAHVAPVVLDEGLYFPSGFEAVISTMETSTVAAWNAVAQLVKDQYGVQLNKTWAEW